MLSHILACFLAMLLSQQPHQAYVLNTDASVLDVAARDLTGDAKAELFLLCCDAASSPLVKFVAVYVAGEAGSYPVQPSSRLDLEPSVSTLFLAETDGAPPVELVAADARGATIYQFAEGRFAPVASPRFDSLLPSGSKEPLFLKQAVADLDGDGIDEWIVPAPSGYEIRTPAGLLCKAPCDVVSEIGGGVYIFHRLPACRTFDLEGASSKCLAFLSDEFVDFAYGPEWSERKRFKIPLDLEERWEASTKMDDIDGDGFPDLVVTQTKGTVNLKAVTHVYLASAPFTYPDSPTATFEAKGAISSPVLIDVDLDNKKDMVFITVPFSVRNVINYLIRRKVSARISVHPFENGGFAEKPAFVKHLTVDAPEGHERVVSIAGDFNGDGRIDIAFAAAADKLVIHTGSAKQLISSRPWLAFEVPGFGEARSYDLNGNESKDLVIFHPGGANKMRVDVLVF